MSLDDNKATRPYKIAAILLIILPFILISIARTSGTVVDAVTGKPIEEAVVLIEWTITKGMGLSYTKSHKVIEAVTNENGNFTIMGSLNPFANDPHITIYKKYYVTWNNLLIFPNYRKREDFKWKEGNIFKLEKFKDSYSYYDHYSFFRSSLRTHESSNQKRLIVSAYENWERPLALKEKK